MSDPAPRRHWFRFSLRTLFVGVTISAAIVAILLVVATGQHTNLVDLNSGRARSQYTVQGRTVYQADRNTEFSRRCEAERRKLEMWVPVTSYQVYSATSPHYRYHSAAFLMGELVYVFDFKRTPPEEQSAQAHELLCLLRQRKIDEAAKFVFKLSPK